jgi:hypothetical protein
LISPNPSTGLPRASTTLPTRPLPTGTSNVSPVALTFSHSLIDKNPERITIQT